MIQRSAWRKALPGKDEGYTFDVFATKKKTASEQLCEIPYSLMFETDLAKEFQKKVPNK